MKDTRAVILTCGIGQPVSCRTHQLKLKSTKWLLVPLFTKYEDTKINCSFVARRSAKNTKVPRQHLAAVCLISATSLRKKT